MFVSARITSERADAPLLALRLSLNAPVVTLDDLPVAPARAGIALQQTAGEAPRLTIAIRSIRTGQLALFEATPGAAPDAVADLDAALSFVEEMGFLLDDDVVAGPAQGLWRELLGLEPGDAPGASESVPVQPSGLGARSVPVEVADTPAPRLALSKFRRHASPPGGSAAAPDLLLQLLAGL